MIQHFLMTRSCYIQQDPKYLAYRLNLFKTFCASSWKMQSRTDFTWLVRVSPDAQNYDECKEILADAPFPVVLVDAPPPDFHQVSDGPVDNEWRKAIRQNLNPDATHILTSRCDDDDGVPVDYVERLRNRVKETQGPSVWNYVVGYVLRVHSAGSKFRIWRYPTNMFASLLSPVETMLLVNDVGHNHIRKLGPFHKVDNDPGFLWVRHPLTASTGHKNRHFKMHIDLLKNCSRFPFLEGVS